MNVDQEDDKGARPDPRSLDAIFEDLRRFAQTDGALHEISAIVYRDWLITFDLVENRVADEPEIRWSTSKLNKNEIVLLLGLMVQSQSDRTHSVAVENDTFVTVVDQLLREFHDRLLADVGSVFDPVAGRLIEGPNAIGLRAREAIYYGADSFYLHQFAKFSRLRYREDAIWLLQNVGLSIRPMIEICDFIIKRIGEQMSAVAHMRSEGRTFSQGDLTNSLIISKADIRKGFGQKADAFFSKFATPAVGANTAFTNAFAVNAVALAPMIDLGEYLYVPNQYRLAESIYESPFYWMSADKLYVDIAAEHRGAFLEQAVAHIARSVFGAENVHQNVTIRRKGVKDTLGEVDVLVVYGEFALVIQAKSKRVTMKARAGDTDALRADFENAIQHPYRQALECAELIQSGADFITSAGSVLAFASVPRIFPVVVLSDPFPAVTYLSAMLLERGDQIAPVIWDIGVLDCVARMLPSPIEMIFYLKSRSAVFGTITSDSEYNYLGFHIKYKLGLPADADWVMLDRDFATIVDDYMTAADVGVTAERPLGIMERIQVPAISELLSVLRNADPKMASVVIDLYDFSSAALENISEHILELRREVAAGKDMKAFSLPTASGGLSYVVTRRLDEAATRASEAVGSKHKYDTKSDRWYVILDSVETTNPIDGLLPLIWPWQEDEHEAANSEQVGRLFNSRQEVTRPGSDEKASGD